MAKNGLVMLKGRWIKNLLMLTIINASLHLFYVYFLMQAYFLNAYKSNVKLDENL
jgi:hypothetical protein